jgi:S1-C subfamily serine protease
VKRIVPQLIKYGKVKHSGRAALGVYVETVTPELAAQYGLPVDHGVLIPQLLPNGPAHKAGIPKGSIIVKVNARTINSTSDLVDVLADKKPGDTVSVTVVIPSGKRRTFEVTLSELPVGSS